MYTSEIRETDPEGKPVTVSPALLARVRETDDALRERLRKETKLEYAGRWTFPDPDRATFALTLSLPSISESFAVSLPYDPRGAERFPHRAVQAVLRHASEANQVKLSRQIRDLVASTIEGD
ncbi:hypothetical protein [Frigoriglobus tundricola]|uniref:Uncharacterized protein n=1 Tax=Frigoriglobus tundricola TaxID=2774151 RepID=A0A6M5YYK3_9BACT|nr:hypothetical protein [Frigoriglobus tundricola]QJW98331.1 hypothetical protein FTUN_5919 [Frigoriglobus tundricola]